MSKRSAKPVAALFASVMAGANLVTVTDLRAQAATADDCLTAPKGATTPGGHWYYRIDRATKRQCWYLREDGDKSTRATPPVSAPATAAEPAEQQPPRATTRKAISDARAEYISQRSRAEQTPPANLEPQTTGTAASTPAVQDSKRSIGTNVLAPTPWATTRLFDGSGVNASSNPADVRTAAVVADPPADQQQADAEPVQQPALQQPAALQPAPGIAFAAADSSTTKPTASLQMLLLVMAAALTLAGIIVSLVFRLGRIRARRAMRRQRRAMWDSVKNKRSPQPARSAQPTRSAPAMRSAPQTRSAPPPMRSAPPTFHREEARSRRAEAAHQPRPQEARPRPQDARERQVSDMLARLARSAQH